MSGSLQARSVYRFGIFQLDLRSGELQRKGLKVNLQDQPLQVLSLLIEHAGEVVTREELQQRLWPNNTFVEFDSSLNTAVKKLRVALGDSAVNPRFIETLPKRGYRFIAEVREISEEPGSTALIVESHSRESVVVEEEDDEAVDRLSGPALLGQTPQWVQRALWLLLAAVISGVLLWFMLRPRPVAATDSIAVLPFDTTSVDSDLEYLADGITESTIDHLARSPGLKVISLGSVLPYRQREATPQQIGRELGVRNIMIGKIIIQQGRMKVLTELISTADGTHLWGEQYDRKLTDIFDVQEDIASEIAAKLRLGETQEQRNSFRRRYTQDFEAYKLYIRGRYYWNKRDVPNLQRGLSYFQQAIDRDPTYALAYAGLADSYFVECAAGALPAREGLPKAKAAALTALQLDDSLAEAHTSLAHILFNYDWNWTEAEAEYQKAIALSPGYSYAHYFYGTFLLAMARNKEAFGELEQAQELDPLSPMIATFIGKGYYYARDNPRAIAEFRKIIEANPGFPVAPSFLIETLERTGAMPDALAAMEASSPLGKQDPSILSLRHAYETARSSGYLQEEIRQVRLDPHAEAGGLSGGTAALYALLGDKDNAFRMLDRAVERHELWLVYLKVDPVWDNLRSDPRFQKLLNNIRFT